jgi:hypothetical protein
MPQRAAQQTSGTGLISGDTVTKMSLQEGSYINSFSSSHLVMKLTPSHVPTYSPSPSSRPSSSASTVSPPSRWHLLFRPQKFFSLDSGFHFCIGMLLADSGFSLEGADLGGDKCYLVRPCLVRV